MVHCVIECEINYMYFVDCFFYKTAALLYCQPDYINIIYLKDIEKLHIQLNKQKSI